MSAASSSVAAPSPAAQAQQDEDRSIAGVPTKSVVRHYAISDGPTLLPATRRSVVEACNVFGVCAARHVPTEVWSHLRPTLAEFLGFEAPDLNDQSIYDIAVKTISAAEAKKREDVGQSSAAAAPKSTPAGDAQLQDNGSDSSSEMDSEALIKKFGIADDPFHFEVDLEWLAQRFLRDGLPKLPLSVVVKNKLRKAAAALVLTGGVGKASRVVRWDSTELRELLVLHDVLHEQMTEYWIRFPQQMTDTATSSTDDRRSGFKDPSTPPPPIDSYFFSVLGELATAAQKLMEEEYRVFGISPHLDRFRDSVDKDLLLEALRTRTVPEEEKRWLRTEIEKMHGQGVVVDERLRNARREYLRCYLGGLDQELVEGL